MNLDLVIGHIKTFVPAFAGNVAGAADYAAVDEQTWLKLPAAFVVPGDEEAGENEDLTGLYQNITETFAVIVVFDNQADRRGQTVTASYDPIKFALFGALINWRPDSPIDNPGLVDPADPAANRSARGLYSGGGALVKFDRARLQYAWTFCLNTVISDADGWQPPSEPLREIDITVPPDTGAPAPPCSDPFAEDDNAVSFGVTLS